MPSCIISGSHIFVMLAVVKKKKYVKQRNTGFDALYNTMAHVWRDWTEISFLLCRKFIRSSVKIYLKMSYTLSLIHI